MQSPYNSNDNSTQTGDIIVQTVATAARTTLNGVSLLSDRCVLRKEAVGLDGCNHISWTFEDINSFRFWLDYDLSITTTDGGKTVEIADDPVEENTRCRRRIDRIVRVLWNARGLPPNSLREYALCLIGFKSQSNRAKSLTPNILRKKFIKLHCDGPHTQGRHLTAIQSIDHCLQRIKTLVDQGTACTDAVRQVMKEHCKAKEQSQDMCRSSGTQNKKNRKKRRITTQSESSPEDDAQEKRNTEEEVSNVSSNGDGERSSDEEYSQSMACTPGEKSPRMDSNCTCLVCEYTRKGLVFDWSPQRLSLLNDKVADRLRRAIEKEPLDVTLGFTDKNTFTRFGDARVMYNTIPTSSSSSMSAATISIFNHLSVEFSAMCEKDNNRQLFSDYHKPSSKQRSRVATTASNTNDGDTYMIFGNNPDSQAWYEAVDCSTQECRQIDVASHIFRLRDEVYFRHLVQGSDLMDDDELFLSMKKYKATFEEYMEKQHQEDNGTLSFSWYA